MTKSQIMVVVGALILMGSGFLGQYLNMHVGITSPAFFWIFGLVAGISGTSLILLGIKRGA
jgi:hypothetical protein